MTNYYRRLPFQNISNFRDVGGHPARDGKMTRFGKLYRSSIFSDASPEDVALFQSLNITGIVDLRSPRELEREPDVFRPLVEHYLPINLSNAQSTGRSAELARTATDDFFMAIRYLEYIDNKEAIAQFFRFLLDHRDANIVYHCSAGKDRTGVLTYLLFGLHGVPLEDIIADYEVSYTYIKNDPNIIGKDDTLNVYHSYPEVIERLHVNFLDRYGSFAAYFQELGFQQEEIHLLGNLLIKE